MKKYLIIILFTVSCASGCDKTNITAEDNTINACGVTSIDQLSWAQTLISGKGPCEFIYKGATITMYDYKGEKVFYFENHASSIGVCTQRLYNCSGAVIIEASAETSAYNDFEANRKNEKIIWKKM